MAANSKAPAKSYWTLDELRQKMAIHRPSATIEAIAKYCNISRSTFYRYINSNGNYPIRVHNLINQFLYINF